MQKLAHRERRIDYLLEYPRVKRWIGSLKEGPGRKIYLYIFHRYMQYVRSHSGFTDPDALIENALDSTVRQLQQHADILQDYLATLENVGDTTRIKHREAVMSFYSNNGVKGVPWAKLKKKNSEIQLQDKSDDAADFVAMMRQVVRTKCSALQLAILLTTYQSFMDDSTIAYVFNYFAFPQLVRHFGTEDWLRWDENRVPVRIDLVRPKSDVQGWTCLHKDAIFAIKLWLSVRYNITGKPIKIYPSPNTRNLPRSDPIFIVGRDSHPIPPEYVSYTFRKLGKTTGINVYTGPRPPKTQGAMIRYLFHSHEVRDTARSIAHTLKVDDEVEFFITHKTDAHRYNKSPWKDPQYFLVAYDKLTPWLNVLSSDPEKIKLESELQQTKKDMEENENRWFLQAKKFEAQLAESRKDAQRMRRVQLLQMRMDASEKAGDFEEAQKTRKEIMDLLAESSEE